MIKWMRAGLLALGCASAVAFAQTGGKAAETKQESGAVEAQVAARFAEKSGQKPSRVFRSRGGLFEVLVGGDILYVDQNVTFVISGRMFDTVTREDLTQKRLDTALKVDFKSLPLQQAIKTTRGDGSRVLVTFEDPNCPYCKRLWQNLQELKNVTIYTFLYPILSPQSHEKSRALWCSKDRARAWDDYMVQGKTPTEAAEDCKHPLDENLALGRQFGISGTPTLIFVDGSRTAGALPLATIEQRLAAAKK